MNRDDPRTTDIDPSFVFDYDPVQGPAEGQSFTTYWDVERLCRGPEPVPDWVVTDRGALDTDLGVLKTGKEADVSLLRREATDGSGAAVVMAAKRYRSEEHRSFHRSTDYTEGRRTRRSRDARALSKKSAHGRSLAAGQWAYAEWDALNRYWAVGVPVPYPVQIDGTEILMELITVGDEVAPRLAQARPGPDLLEEYWLQLREALRLLSSQGMVHGDLSAYNVLATGEHLVIIDLPQVVDIVANPRGMDFLLRDCTNICGWFTSRGLEVDPQELFAELVSYAV